MYAWFDHIRQPFNRSNEFVSRDARRISDPRNYEMLTSPAQVYRPKTPDDTKKGPSVSIQPEGVSSLDDQKEDYFGSNDSHVSPSISFSRPLPPSKSANAITRGGSVNSQGRNESSMSDYASNPLSGMARTGSLSERYRSGSALGLDRIGSISGQTRTGSALSHHRAGSSFGKDWDPSSTFARPSNSPLPEEQNTTHVRQWDPIHNHTTVNGGEYIAQNWANTGHEF